MCVVCIDFSHLLFNRSHTVCGLVVLLSAVGHETVVTVG